MRSFRLLVLAVALSCASRTPSPKQEVSVEPVACPEGSTWEGQLCRRTAKNDPPAPVPAATMTASPWHPPAPQAEDIAAARQHFAQGVKLFGAADYAGALAEFETAYAFKAASAVLYNIGMSLERLGRGDEALDVFEKFLATNPPQAVEVKKRIDALRGKHP